MECRHCKTKEATRARQLCWGCYNEPGVKEKYRPITNCGVWGLGLSENPRPLPKPTKHLPGTREKYRVLKRRAKLEQQLWHPDDAEPTPDWLPWIWLMRMTGGVE